MEAAQARLAAKPARQARLKDRMQLTEFYNDMDGLEWERQDYEEAQHYEQDHDSEQDADGNADYDYASSPPKPPA
jgi:hypothetical protein